MTVGSIVKVPPHECRTARYRAEMSGQHRAALLAECDRRDAKRGTVTAIIDRGANMTPAMRVEWSDGTVSTSFVDAYTLA